MIMALLEKGLEHVLRDLFGPGAVDLVDLLGVGIVGVQATKLTFGISEEQEEVGAVAAIDYVKDAISGVGIDDPGEDHVFNGVENDCPIRLDRGLAV